MKKKKTRREGESTWERVKKKRLRTNKGARERSSWEVLLERDVPWLKVGGMGLEREEHRWEGSRFFRVGLRKFKAGGGKGNGWRYLTQRVGIQ